MTKEIWKFYKETNSRRYGKRVYWVSSYGRVKINGKLYKCTISNQGYYYLCCRPLHRIVAELFIQGCKKDYEVDHINNNKLDNRVTNLRICHNRKENMNNPLTIQRIKENHKEGKSSKSVLQYTLDNKLVKEYVSISEASRQTKIHVTHILKCCKNKYKSAGGYIWKYKEE